VAGSPIIIIVTIRSKLSLLIANYNKNRKDESLQGLHCNGNTRKLELEEVRRYRKDSRKDREVEKRGRREN